MKNCSRTFKLATSLSFIAMLAPILQPLYLSELSPLDRANPTSSSVGSAQAAEREARHAESHTERGEKLHAEIPLEIAQVWHNPTAAFQDAIKTSVNAASGSGDRTTAAAKLRAFTESNAPQAERHVAGYALARLLSTSNTLTDKQAALELFTEVTNFAPLKIQALWHSAEMSAGFGEEDRLRAVLNQILRAHEAESRDISRATYELAQSYLRTKEIDKAVPLLLSLKQRFPSSEFAKGSNYYLGQIALNNASASTTGATASTTIDTPTSLNAKEVENAASYFREYLKGSTGGRFSPEVADKLVMLGTRGVTLTTEDHDLLGSVYFKKGDYTKALAEWAQAGPPSPGRLFQKAQAQGRLGQRQEAVETLIAAIARDPESTSFDEYTDSVTGPLSRADTLAVWKRILELKPKHLDHVLWNIATRSSDQDATPLFHRLLADYPTSEHAPESMWWIFWNQMKGYYPGGVTANKKKAESLIQLADSAVLRYPKHRSAARFAFWSGKLREKIGDHAGAKLAYSHAVNHYPTNYYGARARARLSVLTEPAGKDGKPRHDRGWATSVERPQAPSAWQWPAAHQLFSFEKVGELLGLRAPLLAAAGQFDEAIAYTDSHDDEPHLKTGSALETLSGFKAWLYLSQNQQIDGIRQAAKELGEHPIKTSPRWQIYYPWAYAALINEQAKLRSVDPYLVHALIREESRYYPKALSRSNAIGLMQLLPGTAFGVAKRIGLPISAKEEVFIPENNIKMGTAYLGYTLSRFNGNAMLAVASYNGGPNAVKRWLDQFQAAGGTDFDVFVENIPFRETRDYVRKVFGAYWTYEHLYP